MNFGKNQENVTANTNTHLSEISSEIKRQRQELRKDVENFYLYFDLNHVLQALNNAKRPLYLRAEGTKSKTRRGKAINDLIILDEVSIFLVALEQTLGSLDRLSLERDALRLSAAFQPAAIS